MTVRWDLRGRRPRPFNLAVVPGSGLRGLSLALSLALFATAAIPSTLGPEEKDDKDAYRFRVSVSMVGLSVTVLDRKGRLVSDLDAESFTVYEDGVKQEIEIFSREDLPLRMVILLDTSASMAPRLPIAQEAAHRVRAISETRRPGERD